MLVLFLCLLALSFVVLMCKAFGDARSFGRTIRAEQEDLNENDYYRVLGVPFGADGAEVERAFRTKSRFCPEEGELRQKLEKAHAVLGNPPLRCEYDRQRSVLEKTQPPEWLRAKVPLAVVGSMFLIIPLCGRIFRCSENPRFIPESVGIFTLAWGGWFFLRCFRSFRHTLMVYYTCAWYCLYTTWALFSPGLVDRSAVRSPWFRHRVYASAFVFCLIFLFCLCFAEKSPFLDTLRRLINSRPAAKSKRR